ncbi:hypothetical protein GCM10027217_10350 [Pseudomaricurvus hydrocarbonicus]
MKRPAEVLVLPLILSGNLIAGSPYNDDERKVYKAMRQVNVNTTVYAHYLSHFEEF